MNFGIDYTGGGDGGGGGFGGDSMNSGGGGFNSGGGDSGGGFNNNSGGGGSAQKPRKKYDEQTLIPVTCRMVLNTQSAPHNASEGTGAMSLAEPDGRELYQIKLVGAVRSSDQQSTNVKYEIEDGTGLVDVQQWIDDNDCSAIIKIRDEIMNTPNLYVKIIGVIKEYDNKKTITAHSVRPIKTYNEFIHHMLDVVYSSEKHKKADTIVGGSGNNNMGNMGNMNGVGFGGGGNMQQPSRGGGMGMQQQSGSGGGGSGGGNDLQDLVLNYIRREGEASDQGASIQGCIQEVQQSNSSFGPQDISAAVQDLCAEGHIYSTINEEWYKYAM